MAKMELTDAIIIANSVMSELANTTPSPRNELRERDYKNCFRSQSARIFKKKKKAIKMANASKRANRKRKV